MTDFDEEAKRILKSERERIEADAKYGAGWVILMTGLLWVFFAGLFVWHAIQSVTSGARFPWRDLWSEIGTIAIVFAVAWVYYRLNSSRKMRDARLIRIELKLDKLLEIDGTVHDTPKQMEHDAPRDSFLKNQGWKVLRFRNIEVLKDITSVIIRIQDAAMSSKAHIEKVKHKSKKNKKQNRPEKYATTGSANWKQTMRAYR